MENQQVSQSSHTENECNVLVKRAQADLYDSNCFRLLGLATDAPERSLLRQIQKIRLSSKNFSPSTTISDSNHHLDEESLHALSQRIRDFEVRIMDEFFWFWSSRGEDLTFWNQTHQNLQEQDELQIQQTLESIENRGKIDFISLHNYAILTHSLALDVERVDSHQTLTEERQRLAKILWEKSYAAWRECLTDERVWSHFKDRVRSLNDPRLTTGFVRRFRSTLPMALCLINIQLCRSLLEKGENERALWHLDLIQNSKLDSVIVEQSLSLGCVPIIDHLRVQCHEIRQKAKENPQSANLYLYRDYESIENSVALLLKILPERSVFKEAVCDDVASMVFDCQCYSLSNDGDISNSLEWLLKAELLSVSKMQRHRLQENIRALRTRLENEPCWFCKDCLSSKMSNIKIARGRQYGFSASGADSHSGTDSTVTIPRCTRCQALHARANAAIYFGIAIGFALSFSSSSIFYLFMQGSWVYLYIMICSVISLGGGYITGRTLARKCIPFGVSPESSKWEYPQLKEDAEHVWNANQRYAGNVQ